MKNYGRFPRKRLLAKQFISPLTSLKTPVRELDRIYKMGVKKALLIGLITQLGFFHLLPKKMTLEAKNQQIKPVDIILEAVPRTEQLTQAPPPTRPSIPIPSEDPDIPEDLTIAETMINFDEMPPPLPPPPDTDEDKFVFIAYDSPPELIGGYESIAQYIEYPELARKAGAECKVMVGVLVDEEGNPLTTQILNDVGVKLGFEDAAQKAVMKSKWKPARQRDKPIKVWVSVPISFRLTDVGSDY